MSYIDFKQVSYMFLLHYLKVMQGFTCHLKNFLKVCFNKDRIVSILLSNYNG